MVKHPKPQMGTEKDVLARRVVAVIFDTIIMGIIIGIISVAGLMIVPKLGFAALFVAIFIMLGIWFFYAFLLEGFMGQTLGKKAVGIVVVKADGSPCTYLASFVRNLLRIVDGIAYYLVGFIVLILSNRRQRIGDHIAGTVVVKKSG